MTEKSRLSLAHLQDVKKVLESLRADIDPAMALVILEDVSVGIFIGMRMGLTVKQIVTQTESILVEEAERQVRTED